MKVHADLPELEFGVPANLTTEARVIANGYLHLCADEIQQKLIGKTFIGDYFAGQMFKFIVRFDLNGTMEGKNNAGAHNFGLWRINQMDHTMSVEWDSGWDAAITRIYDLGDKFELYDTTTRMWRTNLTPTNTGKV